MQLTPGQIIDDRFEVEAMVGEGGLAEVYRVRHRELGRIMALKLLTWRKKSLVDRLVLEGRIQAQLNHPNVIAVLDLVRHEGQVGLLMEYVDAENLADYIHRVGATPEDEALELMGPVLAAVHAAHAAGVTHRDLKPANIMLARDGSSVVPKVADFGIAKVMAEVGDESGHKTRAGATMGTPGYLAPEQVHDASTIDGRADVFALGAIAYELVAGSPAFADENGFVAVTATASMRPQPLAERCGGCAMVSAAIDQALERDPDDRFPTVMAFAEALFANRPDLLARLQGTSTGRVSLSIPPTGEAPRPTPSTFALAEPEPAPPPAPLTAGTLDDPAVRRALGGWVAAAVLGTVLVMLGLFAGLSLLVGAPRPTEPTPAHAPVAGPAPVPAPPPDPSPPVAPEALAPTEAVPPTPVEAAVANPRAPTAEPEPEHDPDPEPEPEPEPDLDPLPEAEPVVLIVPTAPTPAPTEPTPAPAARQPPDLTGAWAGRAGSQRIQLDLTSTGGTLTGMLTIYAGAQVRTEALRGAVMPDGQLSFTAGDLAFTGTSGPDGLSGTTMREGSKKGVSWSATPNE